MSEGERRLAAIMFTDMVGYTALGQKNESLSLALVQEQRKLIRYILARHNGREIKTMGDAFLVEFPNALDAVRCAYDIQRAVREFNITLPSERRVHLRVGLHLGDVVESQGDISGDAVNVASRIEPLATDGGVCLTRPVFESTHNKFEVPLVSIGMEHLKNVSEPIEVYKMDMPWEQPVSQQSASFPRDRIAILPFRSMSPDPNDEYFAEGITEEIISTVSGISGLKVISRTSVMGYKATTKKVEEIGRELKVGSVLEGSFRKAGGKIRVTAQLIDVVGDEHLWAQNYDRNFDDIFEVQSDVAKQVAEALRVRILAPEMERIEKKPTESTTAYSLYLHGRNLWNKRGPQDLRKALVYFEQSVDEDPSFALGYVGQADCLSLLATSYGINTKANLERANMMVAKALELDPELAEAHATKGGMLRAEFKLKQAEEESKKAIELKPSYATAHQWYMWALVPQQRWDEALEHIEKAVELDPLSQIINFNLGFYYIWKGEYDRAIEPLRKAIELGGEYAHLVLADVYGRLRMFEEMKREAELFSELNQDTFPLARESAEVFVAVREGDRQTVSRLLPRLEARHHEAGMSAYDVAAVYFWLGDSNRGFDWLERSYNANEYMLLNVKVDRDFDGIRGDPRYLDLLKRLGLE